MAGQNHAKLGLPAGEGTDGAVAVMESWSIGVMGIMGIMGVMAVMGYCSGDRVSEGWLDVGI